MLYNQVEKLKGSLREIVKADIIDEMETKSLETNRPIGEPISDSSDENNDDRRHQQIVGLQEENGIFGHPEVIVPPTFDSDEEEPIRGASPLKSFRTADTSSVVDIAQSSSAVDNNIEQREQLVLLDKANDLEDPLPISNLSYNPSDLESKFASGGRISRMNNLSARERDIEQHESDGSLSDFRESAETNQSVQSLPHQSSNVSDDHRRNDPITGRRGFEYPTGPPPAYSSGEHTPEENPLIGEEDEDVGATIQSRFQGNYGEGSRSMMSAVGVAAAVGAHAVMGNGTALRDRDEFISSDDDSDFSASQTTVNQQQEGFSVATTIAPLGSEERQLLQFIEAYTAETISIEPILKPFLLDYIPAVGDIDAFIKIPRPDEVEDNLGLTVLDEPAANQSDPTILGMQLRSEAKDVVATDAPVKRLDRADKNAREIEQWITSIKELHRSKPPDTVHYSKPMPDIELLMQEWPPEVEEMLKTERLPLGSLEVSLEEYVDICLSLLDIPVHKSRIQSLHVLFTLFNEFRNSQHFRNLAENNLMNNALKENNRTTDRLELG